MAVRAPVGVSPSSNPLLPGFAPFSEHPKSLSAAAALRSPMYNQERRSSTSDGHLAPPAGQLTSPLAPIAPSPVNSDTTQFEEDEEVLEDEGTEAPSSRTETPAPKIEDTPKLQSGPALRDGQHKAPGPALLRVETGPTIQAEFRSRLEDNEPQSVIHIPSGFGTFSVPPRQNQSQTSSVIEETPEEEESAGQRVAKDQDSEDEEEPASAGQTPLQEQAGEASSGHVVSHDDQAAASDLESHASQPPQLFELPAANSVSQEAALTEKAHDAPMAPAPLRTNVAPIPIHDWSRTPRAQTRQDLTNLSRPGSSLASIMEGDDSDPQHSTDDNHNEEELRNHFIRDAEVEINALRTALDECWTLCNTLATLSHIHRERIFNYSGRGDQQEQAWKSCWKLCQNLYNNRGDTSTMTNVTRLTLDLCRDFCQALFDNRARENETADSVLRVSFELNNHLFNMYDRSLPEAFRERTLDFYITLCHRLMKQKSKMGEETDSLLRACWSLAEMLFNLRQNWREGKTPNSELLGSAIQACWELCDLFREGWTQIRPERKTPRPSQTTFTQAFIQAKQTGFTTLDEAHNPATLPGTPSTLPETPTTIFEDTGMSPDEAPMPNIIIMGGEHPSRPNNIAAANPVPNHIPSPHPSIQRVIASATPISAGPGYRQSPAAPSVNMSYPTSAVSESGPNPLSATTNASTIFSHTTTSTIRTPADDPNLVLLKTLFVRAAVLTKRGYTRNSPNTSLNNLITFASNLPDNAFGSQPWQINLLENYRKAIANDTGFKNLGVAGIVGERGNVNSIDIARAVRGMTVVVHGFSWLKDLYRFVFGYYIEDALKAVEGQGALRPAQTRIIHSGGVQGQMQSLTAAVMTSNAANGTVNPKTSTNPGVKGTDSTGQISRRTVSK